MILADERIKVLGHRASDRTGKDTHRRLYERRKSRLGCVVLQYSNLVYYTIRKPFSLYYIEPGDEAVDDLFQELFHSLLRDN